MTTRRESLRIEYFDGFTPDVLFIRKNNVLNEVIRATLKSWALMIPQVIILHVG